MDTFNNCMVVITNKRKTMAQMLALIDLFVMHDRIKPEEYESLIAKMDEVGLE